LVFCFGKNATVVSYKGDLMKTFNLLIGLTLSISLFAAPAIDVTRGVELKAIEAQSLEQVNQVNKKDFSTIERMSLSEKYRHTPFIESLIQNQKSMNAAERIQFAKDAVVFVSFSMPDSLLVDLSEQAHAFHIPVVMRGLVENDFKKTLERLALVKAYADKNHNHFYGIAIDPLWFEQFAIRSVPALVVTQRPTDCENQKHCPHQRFDVVYGNTSIKEGLEIIKDKSVLFNDLADKILQGVRHD